MAVEPHLVCKGVDVAYGQVQVLWDVSLIVGEKDTHWPRAKGIRDFAEVYRTQRV